MLVALPFSNPLEPFCRKNWVKYWNFLFFFLQKNRVNFEMVICMGLKIWIELSNFLHNIASVLRIQKW